MFRSMSAISQSTLLLIETYQRSNKEFVLNDDDKKQLTSNTAPHLLYISNICSVSGPDSRNNT